MIRCRVPEITLLRIKTTDAAKLQNEYAKLVEGLQDDPQDNDGTDGFMTSPGKFVLDPCLFDIQLCQFYLRICLMRLYPGTFGKLNISSLS